MATGDIQLQAPRSDWNLETEEDAPEVARYRWRLLPTAWIHFLLVELFHVYLATLSWRSLMITVNARCLMKAHHISIAGIERYFADLYFLGHASADKISFNKGNSLKLPEATVKTVSVEIWWLIVAWILPAAAIILFLYAMICFCSGKHWSFESGSYLYFTWHFKRSWQYVWCVRIMALSPVILPFLWIVQAFLYTDSSDFVVNLELMWDCTPSGLLLTFALCRLVPNCPVHYWRDCQEFQGTMFRRSFISMFLGTNASFGLKLVDALWTADHGDATRLTRYVPNPNEARLLLEACKRAQLAEGVEAVRRRQLRQEASHNGLADHGFSAL